MSRTLLAALLGSILVVPSISTPASAGWGEFCHGVKVDWHRNNCWPEPFVHADRQAARAPFGVMISNGWQRELTLASYHFDPITNQLNSAGDAKLVWILTQAPEHRRTVFVLRNLDREITATRLDAVQQRTAALLPEGALPDVLVTNTAPRGGSADYIDAINRQYREGIPAPVLPAMQAAGSVGGE